MAGDDVVGDVKEEAKRRLRSSYALSYVLAWCAVNYEFLIVVFSEGGYTDKIGYVALHLHYGQSSFVTFGVPALLAFIPVFLLPVLNQLADLWSKAVEVGGTHLSGRLESGKWTSDKELRDRERTGSVQRDTLRRSAKELMQKWSKSAYETYRNYPKGLRRMQPLYAAAGRLKNVAPELLQTLETVGFPKQGYRMLKLLQSEGDLSQDRLIRDSSGEDGRDMSMECLAILLGAELISFVWDEGTEPVYDLGPKGRDLLDSVAQDYPQAFSQRA